jgi:hypothetical protein
VAVLRCAADLLMYDRDFVGRIYSALLGKAFALILGVVSVERPHRQVPVHSV